MCPNLKDGQVNIASSSKTIQFLRSPDFDGDFFKVSWDAGRDDSIVSTYSRGFNVQDLKHTYDEHGQHTIKFSANYSKLKMETYVKQIKKNFPHIYMLNQVMSILSVY